MIDLENCRAHSTNSATTAEQLQTLERVVLDLMLEIEALRATVINLSSRMGPEPESDHALDDSPAGVAGSHLAYGRQYLNSAFLSHWAAGPTSGWDKVLERFYGDGWGCDSCGVQIGRELLMLRRLGYSDSQLKQYVENARAAESCT